MQLLFRRRPFTWYDSYTICDEHAQLCYRAEGRVAWGSRLVIFDSAGAAVGMIKERFPSRQPCCELWLGEECTGSVRREHSLFGDRLVVDYRDWRIAGSFLEWRFHLIDSRDHTVAEAEQVLCRGIDACRICIPEPTDALPALMTVLAIAGAGDDAGG